MAGRLLSCEELVNRVRSRPAPKRQRTGESSSACPPPSSVPPPTSASASVDPPTLAVDPPPRAPSSSVSDVRVGWPAEIPPTVSLLEGDVPLEAVARRLISPRDSKVLEEGSGLRSAFELLFRQTLLKGNLRAAQVLLEEERRRTAGLSAVLVLRDRRHAEEAKKYADELKACQEALILEIPRYRESEVYQRDVESYITAHGEDVISGWLATEAGQERLASEGVLMYDVGQYTMQRDLYAALRRRDASFDPTAWGLPPALDNPDPAATAESVQPTDAAAEPRSSSARTSPLVSGLLLPPFLWIRFTSRRVWMTSPLLQRLGRPPTCLATSRLCLLFCSDDVQGTFCL
nr:tubby-related protein 1-like isoform X2 [Ipomoea batatas]